jgi:hypothetical protein
MAAVKKDGLLTASDIVVPGAGGAEEGTWIVKRVKESWPDAMVQEASSEEIVWPEDSSISKMREFFIYESLESALAWAMSGAVAATNDSMIHVLLGQASTTLVAAGPGTRTLELAEALRGEIESMRREALH